MQAKPVTIEHNLKRYSGIPHPHTYCGEGNPISAYAKFNRSRRFCAGSILTFSEVGASGGAAVLETGTRRGFLRY